MPLPVLRADFAGSPEDLMRLFLRTQLHWSRHLAEETVLDWGTVFANPQLPGVVAANRVMDVSLPAEMMPQQAVDEVNAAFAKRKGHCRQWVMAASGDAGGRQRMVEHLLRLGCRERSRDVMYLVRGPRNDRSCRRPDDHSGAGELQALSDAGGGIGAAAGNGGTGRGDAAAPGRPARGCPAGA